MAGLAVAYVSVGLWPDAGVAPPTRDLLQASITAVFVAEFAVRLWAAGSRRAYIAGHLPDLVALLPAVRGLRLLRLLRLVRLVRTVPLLYRATGLDVPLVRRLAWHVNRVQGHFERRLVTSVAVAIFLFIVVGALIVTLIEKEWTLNAFVSSVYWATNTVLGSGDTSQVSSPTGWLISWLLILMGLTLLAIGTGTLVGFIINVALKEGRGMGAAGYHGHIVICGWNGSAREVIEELKGDEYATRIALVCEGEKNPAGDGVYFVSGDPTQVADLERAGIAEAAAALIFPADSSDEADMRSILTVLAIESIAPDVRTLAEVNNSRHIEHFRRARVNEILVPSQIAAHLAARSALYPGLSQLVADIVAGGEGSELYRIQLPSRFVGRTAAELASQLHGEYRATLMAISRNGVGIVNPKPDLVIEDGDDALVMAESIALLRPLEVERATPVADAAPA